MLGTAIRQVATVLGAGAAGLSQVRIMMMIMMTVIMMMMMMMMIVFVVLDWLSSFA